MFREACQNRSREIRDGSSDDDSSRFVAEFISFDTQFPFILFSFSSLLSSLSFFFPLSFFFLLRFSRQFDHRSRDYRLKLRSQWLSRRAGRTRDRAIATPPTLLCFSSSCTPLLYTSFSFHAATFTRGCDFYGDSIDLSVLPSLVGNGRRCSSATVLVHPTSTSITMRGILPPWIISFSYFLWQIANIYLFPSDSFRFFFDRTYDI